MTHTCKYFSGHKRLVQMSLEVKVSESPLPPSSFHSPNDCDKLAHGELLWYEKLGLVQ